MTEMLNKLLLYGSDISILYVEDDENVCRETTLLLGRFFKKIVTCPNGLEGLLKYKKFYNIGIIFDLIITDINMPKMNGLEMIKQIKEINVYQQFLIISSHKDSGYFMEIIKLNVDGYLLKPIETEQFIDSLYRSVDKINSKKENIKYQSQLESKTKELEVLNNSLELRIKHKTKKLEKQLFFDGLTGLKSRFIMNSEIKDDTGFSLLILIDISDFHSFNEYYGHRIGDVLLKQFAFLLKTFESLIDYEVYRVSGDQFVLYSENIFIDFEEIEMDINNLFTYLNKKSEQLVRTNSTSKAIDIHITAGIAIAQKSILSKADMALSHAKKNHLEYAIYNLDIDSTKSIENKTKWYKRLKKSINKDSFIPFFQPIVDRNQNIIKYESLMRLDYKNEVFNPGDFLDISIKTKQYNLISYLVIKKTLKIVQENRIDISINLTFQDIKNANIVYLLEEKLINENIGQYIIFEFVESEEITDFNLLSEFIAKFKTLGVRIAIDDFGSGYSNFSHILKLKPDYLKIDGSLIKNINENNDSYELVKGIINFSKELGIKTIAEYICSKEIFDTTHKLGIDEYQGYHFGKPLRDIIILPQVAAFK